MGLEKKRIQDPVLTNIMLGVKRPDDFHPILFPEVLKDQEAGIIMIDPQSEFKDYNTERAIRAGSNLANPDDLTPLTYTMTEHDHGRRIDYRELSESKLFNKEKIESRKARTIILNKIERSCAALALNASNYASGHTQALSGESCWSDKDNSDPWSNLKAALRKVTRAIGAAPNHVFFGAQAMTDLCDHPDTVERVKYVQKAVINKQTITELLDGPEVHVGWAKRTSDAGVDSDVWGDAVIVAYIAPPPPEGIERDEAEPAFGYLFRKRGMPMADKYDLEGGKVEIVRCTDICVPKILMNNAAFLITNTNASL